ncbi:MAG: triose-phosphate isomerase [Minisyncoccia bacterium]
MVARGKKIVIGNWKAYLEKGEDMRALALALKRHEGKFKNTDVWLAPPYPFLPMLVSALKASHIRVGAQNVSASGSGAHTGEVTAMMLKGAGASFSIVGHSERRAMGESNESVAAALESALSAGLKVVLCIGERERDEHGEYFEFLEHEMRTALANVLPQHAPKLIVAYEPIWAIGKSAGDAARPEAVRETAIFIRKLLAERFGRGAGLKVPVLYGGSVEKENAAALVAQADVGGFLVGHASADSGEFLAIIEACSEQGFKTQKSNSKQTTNLKPKK